MKQTLVIGSAVVDVIVKIPHLPTTGEDIHIISQTRALGGCAYLTSQILHRFAAPYSLCTAVGGGLYGDFVYKGLQARKVPIYVHRPEEENGCCYCMVEADGERTFIVDHGIEYTFHESYLSNIDTASVDSVYICGLEIEEETGMHIIAYLEKHPEYQVYFAPSPRILHIPQERMARVLSLHPIVHLNEQEIRSFTSASNVADAAKLLYQKTSAPVIVTLGAAGAYCYDGEAAFHAPPVPAVVADTIGAGDSHIGAVIAGLRHGLCLQDAVLMANHISAAVIAQSGGELTEQAFLAAIAGMPDRLRAQLHGCSLSEKGGMHP